MALQSNSEELALMAQEIGAEVISGPVSYHGEMGDVEDHGSDV